VAGRDAENGSPNVSADVQGNATLSEAVERDELERVKHISVTTGTTVHKLDYVYDDRGSLIGAGRDGTVTEYAYDANGKRPTLKGPRRFRRFQLPRRDRAGPDAFHRDWSCDFPHRAPQGGRLVLKQRSSNHET
jgi:hypothetical protein